MEKAVFGAGCFWGVEEKFRALTGVKKTSVGYSGGELENPTYEDVCSGVTGHAEVVEVIFDPKRISFGTLLETFWASHDPTTPNRQGFDVGTQYRSTILYSSPGQEAEAHSSLKRLENSGRIFKKIVTEIRPLSVFWLAEEYHQQYLEKRKQVPWG